MATEKLIPYGDALDNFGKELVKTINELQRDSLKPALVSDVVKIYGAIFCVQQMMVNLYNGYVKNFDKAMETLNGANKKIEDLETRIAGYSERINSLSSELDKLKK